MIYNILEHIKNNTIKLFIYLAKIKRNFINFLSAVYIKRMFKNIQSALAKFFTQERVLFLVIFIVLAWGLLTYSGSKSFNLDGMSAGTTAPAAAAPASDASAPAAPAADASAPAAAK